MKEFSDVSRAATCASGVIPERFSRESVVTKRRDPVTLRAAKPYGMTYVWGGRTANDYMASAGFTLIELLVVVLIIGILSAVALPQYTKAVEKSRATEALTMIRAAIQAEEAYYLANGEYTDDMEALDISIPSTDNFYLESLADGDEDDSRIQIYNERTGMRSWWIYYYKNKTLNCQVEKEEPSGSLARSVCKSFSSKEVTCLEPEYDCYVMN
ncbi:MAG: prepilin-type N-terminal cleavage/methylation domain-containing protein [Elusimicrobia bacterium]|nr:prepilin-type N-terminal cleavage/methylation domain-containing protein [Elusimicrobiota bacterium]